MLWYPMYYPEGMKAQVRILMNFAMLFALLGFARE